MFKILQYWRKWCQIVWYKNYRTFHFIPYAFLHFHINLKWKALLKKLNSLWICIKSFIRSFIQQKARHAPGPGHLFQRTKPSPPACPPAEWSPPSLTDLYCLSPSVTSHSSAGLITWIPLKTTWNSDLMFSHLLFPLPEMLSLPRSTWETLLCFPVE